MFHWTRTVRCCALGLRSPLNAISLLCIITLFPLNLNAQKNVVSLSPTFDLDGDGLSEFLAIEKKGMSDEAPSSAVYYEIDDFGAHMEIWRHTTVDHLITAQIGDINGDESPEIVLLSRSSSLGAGADDLPWLKVFQWTGVDFSPSPSLTIGGVKNNARIRPSGLTILDFDNNESDEIVYAEGSPTRLVSVKVLNEIDGELNTLQELSSDVLNVGSGPLFVTQVDYNEDNFPDLMAVSPEQNRLRIQVFISGGGRLTKGPSAVSVYSDKVPMSLGLIQSGIAEVDIDEDGIKEVVLPFELGAVLAIKKQGDAFQIVVVDLSQASLFQFKNPLTETDINEILLNRAELGMVGSALHQLSLSASPVIAQESEAEVEPEPQLLSQAQLNPQPVEDVPEPMPEEEPEPVSQSPLSRVQLSAVPVAPSETVANTEPHQLQTALSGRMQQVALSSVNSRSNDIASAPSAPPTASPPAGKMRLIQLSTLGKGAGAPVGSGISDTLYVGEKFVYPVEPSSGTIISFRPVSLPSGASFDPSSKVIIWTPVPSQVGVHPIEFQMTVEGSGERPVVNEVRGQGVTIRSSTKVESVLFTVLVQP